MTHAEIRMTIAYSVLTQDHGMTSEQAIWTLLDLYDADQGDAMQSRYLCQRCNCAVISWLGGWKHATGGPRKSCGKPPEIIERAGWKPEPKQQFPLITL